MQRLIGNNAVMRMLAQRAPEDEEEPVQRAPEDEEEPVQRAPEDEEEPVQAKFDGNPGPEGGALSADSASAIQSARGSGSPLDTGVRDRMEQAFNTDFSDVRVHSDASSAALNRGLSSKAFTTGSDVFLGPNANAADQHLLAHELTHVVQQRSMDGAGSGMRVGAAGDAYEQEADTVAHHLEAAKPEPERD
jgi:hypothetical protein